MTQIPLPSMSAPAARALANAGYTHLGQLDGAAMPSLLALHGMGANSIGLLRRAMAEHGWSFAEDDPAVGAPRAAVVRLEAGVRPDRNANATAPTDRDAAAWVAALPKPRQRADGAALLQLFGEVTGEPPVMWGPSIVGYGALHYTYRTGREGDMPRVGFSPRASALTLYVLTGHPDTDALLDRLGKHRRSVACLYINKLADVDVPVLRELVTAAWQHSGITTG